MAKDESHSYGIGTPSFSGIFCFRSRRVATYRWCSSGRTRAVSRIRADACLPWRVTGSVSHAQITAVVRADAPEFRDMTARRVDVCYGQCSNDTWAVGGGRHVDHTRTVALSRGRATSRVGAAPRRRCHCRCCRGGLTGRGCGSSCWRIRRRCSRGMTAWGAYTRERSGELIDMRA